jgi:hypothetical protein
MNAACKSQGNKNIQSLFTFFLFLLGIEQMKAQGIFLLFFVFCSFPRRDISGFKQLF